MSGKVVCRRLVGAPNRAARRRAGFRQMSRATCSGCGTPVLVSPSGRQLLAAGSVAVCDVCASRDIAASGQPAALAMTAEAVEEVEARRRAFARLHGITLEAVATWPPATLRAALDAVERHN